MCIKESDLQFAIEITLLLVVQKQKQNNCS